MSDFRILVRSYRLLRPLDWAEDCEAEMARMTALWNALVVIDDRHRADYRALVTNETVAALQADINAMVTRRDALVQERADKRKIARAKVKTPELDAQIAAINAALKPLIEQYRAARKSAADDVRPAIANLEERRKRDVAAARRTSGLFWGNYNAVCQSFERARAAALKSKGLNVLKARTGNSSRIVNQIQGGATVEELLAGKCSQVRIVPLPLVSGNAIEDLRTGKYPQVRVVPANSPNSRAARKRAVLGHVGLRATIFTRHEDGKTTRRTVTWPLLVDRPFPKAPRPRNGAASATSKADDVRIQEVVIVRRLRAGKWQWQANFLCRVRICHEEKAAKEKPTEEKADASPRACGIDIGWRQTDHGLRVAIIASDTGVEEIALPAEIIRRFEACYERNAARVQARHELLLRLSTISWERAPAPLNARAAVLDRRDAKGDQDCTYLELRALAATWELFPNFYRDARDEALEWLRDDRAAALATSAKQRVLLARREFYRIAAKRIVDAHDVIGLEKVDWSQAATAAKGQLPASGRRSRFIASPSEFLGALVSAARREDVRLHYYAGKSSFLCHACAEVTAVNNPGELYFTCGGCGKVHDQDHNAARVLLAAAKASAPVMPEPPLPPAWQKRLAAKQKKPLPSARVET